MNLPPVMQRRILFILYHLPQLRDGTLVQADPRWLPCVEEMLSALSSDEKRRFFDLYFVQGATPDSIKNELFIETSTFYEWRRELLWSTAIHAAAHGLLFAA